MLLSSYNKTTADIAEGRGDIALIYYRCADREEAERMENKLRAYTKRAGMHNDAVLYDRPDAPPFVLFEICRQFRGGKGIRILMPSESNVCFDDASSESVVEYLRLNGFIPMFAEPEAGIKPAPEDELLERIFEYSTIDAQPSGFVLGLRKGGARTSGKLPFGYRFEQGRIEKDGDESELARRAFELFSEGTPPCEVLKNLGTGGKAEKLTRSRLYNMLKNERYVGALDENGNACPQLVSVETWLKAAANLKKRSGEDDAEPRFLLDRVYSHGKRLLRECEKTGNKRAYYLLPGGERVYADAVEKAITEFFVERFIKQTNALKSACFARERERLPQIEAEMQKASERLKELKGEAEEALKLIANAPSRCEIERLERIKGRTALTEIECAHLARLNGICSQDETRIAAFFEHLCSFDELTRLEKRYFLDVFVKRVTVKTDELTVLLLDIPLRRVHIAYKNK